MPEVRESIDIRAPIERVFAIVTDPHRGMEWNPNILDVQNVSTSTPGEGTTWQQTTVMLGRPTQLQCRITRFHPPRDGVLEITGQYRARITTRCEEVDGATRVTQILEFVPPGGPLGKMAANFIKPTLHRELSETLNRQRESLESEETINGFGAS